MVFPWVPMKSCVFFRLYTHFLTHKPLRSQDCSPLIRYDCEVTDTSQVLSEADLMGSSWGGGGGGGSERWFTLQGTIIS